MLLKPNCLLCNVQLQLIVLLSRSPLRISLLGGGSDLPSYLQYESGQVLAFSIDKYVYIAIHDFFAGGIRVSYSSQEHVMNPSSLQHPIFREALLALEFNDSVEIGAFADVPANGTGLGSSSAFTNALLAALYSYKSRSYSSEEIARLSCFVEIERCKQPIGYQDQWATAIGGLNHFYFDNKSVSFESLGQNAQTKRVINDSLRLFYLNFGRAAGEILREVNSNISNNSNTRVAIKESINLIPDMKIAVSSGNVAQVGAILDEAWKLKQTMSTSVTTPAIQEIYSMARRSGALGGKVVGAGGGGFLLLCVPQDEKERFDNNFSSLRELPFAIEFNGLSIAYDDRE